MDKIDKMKDLIFECNLLEVIAKTHSDNYGPDSDEVKAIDVKIADLNAQMLDLMCPE